MRKASATVRSAQSAMRLTEEGDDGVAGALVAVDGKLGGADGLQDEKDEHSGSRDEEEGPPSYAVAVQTTGDGIYG